MAARERDSRWHHGCHRDPRYARNMYSNNVFYYKIPMYLYSIDDKRMYWNY